MAFTQFEEGKRSPASLTRPQGTRYKWETTGLIYRQDAPGISSVWVLDQGEPTDGNGIYSGSNSLIENTVVTMDGNNLQFDSNTLTGLLTIDQANNRIGVGVASPNYGYHMNNGDFYVQAGNFAVGGSTPTSLYRMRATVDDTNGNNAAVFRADLSMSTTTGNFLGLNTRCLANMTGAATSVIRGVDSNLTPICSGGAVDVIGIRARAVGTGNATNYAVEFVDGTEGTGKVLTCIDATGKANWADPVAPTPVYTEYDVIISQAGIGKPNADFIINDTIGGAWSRAGDGYYQYTKTSGFPDVSKIQVLIGPKEGDTGELVNYRWFLSGDSKIEIYTWNNIDGADKDDLLKHNSLTIRVYP